MPSNKLRLYVALYLRSGRAPPDSYHWALLVGPKKEDSPLDAMQYHVKNTIQPGVDGQPWMFEESRLDESSTRFRLLVRVLIAKIADPVKLPSSLRNVALIQNTPDWTCRVWVMEALSQLELDGVLSPGRQISGWSEIEKECRWYVDKKKAENRWEVSKLRDADHGDPQSIKIPTWDLLR
ncbi:hypothetical protein GX50_02959 [[Emmonsia] crescens]|uniref:Uncharacterized protein n=1 Tax=[Emmonsia] crescens TaxID=73230 RepID=A0A2B7ZKN1_9EURO|nr:hypothetical protein GX50_02959 [Emmonsia crescens]